MNALRFITAAASAAAIPPSRSTCKAHSAYGGMTPGKPHSPGCPDRVSRGRAVERLDADRPHPEQAIASALGVLGLQRQSGRQAGSGLRTRPDGSHGQVMPRFAPSLITAFDRAPSPPNPVTATPRPRQYPGPGYYSNPERTKQMLTHPTPTRMDCARLTGMADAWKLWPKSGFSSGP